MRPRHITVRVDAEGSREVPSETGRRLVTLARPGRNGNADEEQRVTLDEHEGHKFVSVRMWFRGTDGVFYPTRKGTTIRKAELYETIRGLCVAARELGVDLHPKSETKAPEGAPGA